MFSTPCAPQASKSIAECVKASASADFTVQESESNTIDLSDDTKRVIYRLVEFLYRGDYQEFDHPDYQTIDKDLLASTGTHHAVLHAEMFAVGDKYDIAALGDAAKAKFKAAISKKDFTNGHFLDVIPYVYSTTPKSNRGLRDVVCCGTQNRGSVIRTDPVLKSRLAEIVSATPQFAWDLIEGSLLATSVKECSSCKTGPVGRVIRRSESSEDD